MKRIGILFIICMLLTCQVRAFENQDYTDTAALELIEYLSDTTGIEFNGFSDDIVTRGEFIVLLSKILTKNVPVKENCVFKDVNADSELSYALNYAQKAGIVSAAKEFLPNDELTKDAAVKMAVCALGYRVKSELSGGYPLGYMRVARDIYLTDGIGGMTECAITSNEAYVLLGNMLRANMYELYSVKGEYKNYGVSNGTILSSIYDIECTEGIVRANAYTSLTDSNGGVGTDRIRIGTRDVNYYGTDDYLGYNVRAYIRDADGANECVLLEPCNTKTITFSGREYKNTDNENVNIYSAEGEKKSFNLDSNVKYIFNKKAIGAAAAAALPKDNEYSVTMVDSDEDNIYDCVIIKQYRYCVVKGVDTNKGIITDVNGIENQISLPDDEKAYKFYGSYNGEEISSAGDIQSDMLLAAVISTDGTAADVYVCDKTKNVKVVSHNAGDLKLRGEDGNAYEYGAYFKKYYEKDVSFDSAAVLMLGMNGEIVAGSFKSSGSAYGWLVAQNRNTGIFGKSKIKIFSESGKMSVFDISDKATLNGGKPTAKIDDVIAGMSENNRLIKYALNSDGEIKNIDTAEPYAGGLKFPDYDNDNNSLTLFYNGYSSAIRFRSETGSFDDKFGIKNAVVFVIPKKVTDRGDDDLYRTTSASGLLNDESYTVMSYDYNESMEASAVVVFEDSSDISKVTSDGMVVQDVYKTLDNNGENCYGISISDNGTYKTLYSCERTETAIKGLRPGDIIRVGVSGSTVRSIRREYSYEENKLFGTYGEGANTNWVSGLVYETDGNTMSIANGICNIDGIEFDKLRAVTVSSAVSYIHIKTGSNGKNVESAVVRPTLDKDIRGARLNGTNASFAVVQRRYYSTRRIFIYVID